MFFSTTRYNTNKTVRVQFSKFSTCFLIKNTMLQLLCIVLQDRIKSNYQVANYTYRIIRCELQNNLYFYQIYLIHTELRLATFLGRKHHFIFDFYSGILHTNHVLDGIILLQLDSLLSYIYIVFMMIYKICGIKLLLILCDKKKVFVLQLAFIVLIIKRNAYQRNIVLQYEVSSAAIIEIFYLM